MENETNVNSEICSTNPKPQVIPVYPNNIPLYLKERAQWVVWRYEIRDGKWTKPPFNPHSGEYAKTNEHSTWASFEESFTLYQQGLYDGIGFVFQDGDDLVGLDLDHCVDHEKHTLTPQSEEILQAFKKTYCELSPSGTGVRVFCFGTPQRRGKGNGDHKWIELYDHESPR